ncbi:MAG: carbamoyl transferase [Verrucomicrobiae bacterium]|nr:carbamoyl transferase [Verrucomicrobiae bacterium]
MGNWDAAAALAVEGRIVAAAEEERFTRIKHAPGNLPTHSIRYCLRAAGLRIQDIDLVVFPGITYRNIEARLREYFLFVHGHAPKFELCDHHEAHAAAAFLGSGFDEALVVTYDYSGDGVATTVSVADQRGLRPLRRWPFPQSLGLFYATITQHLGFDFGEDEYKVMGLASYGRPTVALDGLLTPLKADYKLDGAGFRSAGPGEPPLSTQEPLFNSTLLEWLGPARLRWEEIGPRHMDLASSAQALLERTALGLFTHYRAETGLRRACVAGGVAMNCVLNQKIAEAGLFDALYVPPVAGDNGLAFGAALLAAWKRGFPLPPALPTAAMGPEYSEDEIARALSEVGSSSRECPDPAAEAARMVAEGKIVGWHQGRMEYGARALGHRSILADPRLAEMKDRVNAVVKFREGFRPFAPSVPLESAGNFFEKPVESPFMTRTFGVRTEARPRIPAVTHADNTARVQTVRAETEPLYHRFLVELGRRTGVPVSLNTSFNIRGQPIVENPNQAISTFYGSGLDALFLGKRVVEKKRP